jgi:hypothetical protein
MVTDRRWVGVEMLDKKKIKRSDWEKWSWLLNQKLKIEIWNSFGIWHLIFGS